MQRSSPSSAFGVILGFIPSPLAGALGIIEIGTSLDRRWKRIEVDRLDESGFERGGETAVLVAKVVC